MGKVTYTYVAREIVSSRRALAVPRKKNYSPRVRTEGGGRETQKLGKKGGKQQCLQGVAPVPSPFFCRNPSSVDHRSRKLFFILAYIYRVRGGSLRATQTENRGVRYKHAHTVCFIYLSLRALPQFAYMEGEREKLFLRRSHAS